MTFPHCRTSEVRRGAGRFVLGLALVVSLTGFTSLEALFAPKSELWPRWQEHDAASTLSVDHGPWSTFLDRYVSEHPDGINRVAYRRVTTADRTALDGYINALTATPVSRLSRGAQLPYWINLYNALTVQVILQNPEARGIRDIDISPGFLSDGPWGKKVVEIEAEKLSLNDIEHRVLRPIWNDPRIHYAVNCAALGCPNLQRRAFTAGNADALLDAAAKAYVNHPRAAAVTDGKLIVSSIYVWFHDDFGGNDAGVIAHLKKYAEPRLAAELAGVKRIEDHAYDWHLNTEMTSARSGGSHQRRAER